MMCHGHCQLFEAAENGHSEVVELLLANSQVNPHLSDKNGWTPLHIAAFNGHIKIVKMLIAKINPNRQINNGANPLYLAAENGHSEIVELLLANSQVNPHLSDKNGWTPLHIAAFNGHIKIVKMLIAKINPNRQINNGANPLYLAAENGHSEVVELLLADPKVDPNLSDNRGWTPLHIAALNGHIKIVKMLIAKINPNQQINNGASPLYLAAENGHSEVVELLFADPKVDPNLSDNRGWTSLHIAALNGHIKIVKMLIAKINPNQQINNGASPLYLAAENGHNEIIEFLLANSQVNPNLSNKNGWTPLHIAASNGYAETVKKLISKNANIHAKTNEKENFLLLAIQSSHQSVVNIVIELGLMLAFIDENGMLLSYVPRPKPDECSLLSLEVYRHLCFRAVSQDGLALQFVPAELRADIIQKISVAKILADNYEARRYFPKNIDYQSQINSFLSGIEHVVITKNKCFEDYELKDMYLVYANSLSRTNKTIHVDIDDANKFFDDLGNQNNHAINLVLLGHAAAHWTVFAGMSIENMKDFIQKHRKINRVTLLGCNTAKSLLLDQEKEMIADFVAFDATNHYGVVLTTREFSNQDYLELLSKSHQSGKWTGAFVLIRSKIDETESYTLVHIRRNPKSENDIIAERFQLDLKQLKELKNAFKTSKLAFPKDSTIFYHYLAGVDTFVSQTELLTLFEMMGKFSQRDSQYENFKQHFPFLRSGIVKEVNKLQTSLFTKLVNALIDSQIKRKLTIKGYTKAVHVDTKKQRMVVTRTHLYPSNYGLSLFYKNGINIDRTKMKVEWSQMMNEMKGEINPSRETFLKSIKFTLN